MPTETRELDLAAVVNQLLSMRYQIDALLITLTGEAPDGMPAAAGPEGECLHPEHLRQDMSGMGDPSFYCSGCRQTINGGSDDA